MKLLLQEYLDEVERNGISEKDRFCLNNTRVVLEMLHEGSTEPIKVDIRSVSHSIEIYHHCDYCDYHCIVDSFFKGLPET